jgi:glycosyltransferase involved in cell wall biosynthesis
MKIALVTLYNPFKKTGGGIETVTYYLSSSFAKLGHEVSIICADSGAINEIHEEKGINLITTPVPAKSGNFLRSLMLIKARKSIRTLDGKGFEIFIGQGGFCSPLVFNKPKQGKVILVVHTLDWENLANIRDLLRLKKKFELFSEIFNFFILKIWRIIYFAIADELIFVSKIAEKDFKTNYWFFHKKTYVIPNGHPTVEKISNERKYDFTYLGRLDKRKGVDLIINAAKILNERSIKHSINILGDGPYADDLKKIAGNLGLKDIIKFYGHVNREDASKILSESKGLVLPSFYESDPLVIREALSYGIPCIVPNIPPFNEYITEGVNGFFFKVGSVSSLASSMEYLIKMDEKQYVELLHRTLSFTNNRDWEKVALEYLGVFAK